jgi:hypothetical protein
MTERKSLLDARLALEENVRKHFKRETHPILWNQNVALLGICDCLERLERDVNLLHAKLQPILKELIADQHDWQSHTRGD